MLACFTAFALGTGVIAASDVTLGWDASPEAGIAGYHLYYGSASGSYTNMLDVGNVTTATVSGLIPGIRYYFAATSYDNAGEESPFCAEISYVAGGVTLRVSINGKAATLTGTAPPGYTYNVLATVDLVHWTRTGSVTADASGRVSFIASAGQGAQFYRLQQVSP